MVDLTHNVCQKKFKLEIVSFAGNHFVRFFWRSTVLPVFYRLYSKENTSAYVTLLQVVFKEFQTFVSVDLRSKVCAVLTDGAVAAKNALELLLPGALQILCLENAKRNFNKKGKLWLRGNHQSD